MKKQFLSLLILTIFPTSLLYAGPQPAESFSLEQCLRIAYQKNPLMREARHQSESAKGDWLEAEALPDPEIEIDIGGLKRDGSGSRKGSVDTFTVRQPLDPLGTRFLRGRMAHDEVRIAGYQTARAWTEVSTKVRELYAEILTREKEITVVRNNLDATRQFLTAVESKFQSGSVLKSDLIRAGIENSRAENEVLVVEKDLKLAKGRMNVLLGRAVEDEFVPDGVLAYEPLQQRYETLMEKAKIERSDLKAAEIRLSQKKKGVWSEVLTAVFPKMSIGVERVTESFDNDTSLLIAASYPLWGFNLGGIKKAKAEKKIHEVRLDAFKSQISLEVYEAFTETDLADKQVRIQKQFLEETNELLRQTTLQYQEAEMSFLSYLENIKTIKETRLGYFQALKNFKEKLALLEQAVGEAAVPGEGEPHDA